MHRKRASYQLTRPLAAAYGGAVLCLDERGYGRTYRLYSERPGAALNARLDGPRPDAFVIGPDGDVIGPATTDGEGGPAVTRVDIRGAIEQRAGFHDECGGWSDGHDAIAERMIAALEIGDVVLVIDSPGGAAAGLQENVRRVVSEKAEHGRKVYVYADEMIGSAAFWWAACVADAIYLPEAGIVGSVGARSSHESIAGMLAQDGVEVTHFAWPGPGKVAFAPDLPLSDLGKQRGERDVSIAGEAFCAAVCAARGTDRESIVDLGADALTGALAVNARLADQVATLEDVIALALREAGAQDPNGMTPSGQAPTNDSGVAAWSPSMAGIRSEGDPKGGKGEPDGDEGPAGAEKVPSDCGACGLVNEDDAKYCKGCGQSLGTKPAPEGEPDGDEPKPGAPPAPQAPKKPPPPQASARSVATVAAQLGLRTGASELAVTNEVARIQNLVAFASKLTGKTDHEEIKGQLRAMKDDAAESGKLRESEAAAVKRDEWRDRLDLVGKLEASGLFSTDEFHTHLDGKGQPIVDANGKATRRLRTMYAAMPLGELKGFSDRKLANVPAKGKSPFQPDRAAAETAATKGDVEGAKHAQAVINAAKSGIDINVAAESYAARFGGAS